MYLSLFVVFVVRMYLCMYLFIYLFVHSFCHFLFWATFTYFPYFNICIFCCRLNYTHRYTIYWYVYIFFVYILKYLYLLTCLFWYWCGGIKKSNIFTSATDALVRHVPEPWAGFFPEGEPSILLQLVVKLNLVKCLDEQWELVDPMVSIFFFVQILVVNLRVNVRNIEHSISTMISASLTQVNSASSKTSWFTIIFFLGSVMAETVRISAAGVGPHRAVGAWRGSP